MEYHLKMNFVKDQGLQFIPSLSFLTSIFERCYPKNKYTKEYREVEVEMEKTILKPRFVIDENGRKSAVLLSIKEYNQLMDVLEELADASDFSKAKNSSKKLISTKELRQKVLKTNEG